MATLYIAEFAGSGISQMGTTTQVAAQPPNAEQTVTIAAGSAQSSAFQANTRMVRLSTDAICSVLFGTNPTATAAKCRLAANQTEYFTVPLNQSYKVAVITNT